MSVLGMPLERKPHALTLAADPFEIERIRAASQRGAVDK